MPEVEQIEIIPGYTAFENEIKAVLIGYILNSNDKARQLLRTFHVMTHLSIVFLHFLVYTCIHELTINSMAITKLVFIYKTLYCTNEDKYH